MESGNIYRPYRKTLFWKFYYLINRNFKKFRMKKTTSETRNYRKDMNDIILNSGFNDFKKFFALDNKAYINGALDAKTKELQLIAPDFFAEWKKKQNLL